MVASIQPFDIDQAPPGVLQAAPPSLGQRARNLTRALIDAGANPVVTVGLLSFSLVAGAVIGTLTGRQAAADTDSPSSPGLPAHWGWKPPTQGPTSSPTISSAPSASSSPSSSPTLSAMPSASPSQPPTMEITPFYQATIKGHDLDLAELKEMGFVNTADLTALVGKALAEENVPTQTTYSTAYNALQDRGIEPFETAGLSFLSSGPISTPDILAKTFSLHINGDVEHILDSRGEAPCIDDLNDNQEGMKIETFKELLTHTSYNSTAVIESFQDDHCAWGPEIENSLIQFAPASRNLN